MNKRENGGGRGNYITRFTNRGRAPIGDYSKELRD